MIQSLNEQTDPKCWIYDADATITLDPNALLNDASMLIAIYDIISIHINIHPSKLNAPDASAPTYSQPITAIIIQAAVWRPAQISNFIIALPARRRSSRVI
jgi:hypothetical protein